MIRAQGIQNTTQRNSAIARAYELFGGFGTYATPQSATQAIGLDPGTLNSILTPDVLAATNQLNQQNLSALARINLAHSQAVTTLRNQLAARGALSSGEANYEIGNHNGAVLVCQNDVPVWRTGELAGIVGAFREQLSEALALQQRLPVHELRRVKHLFGPFAHAYRAGACCF
jgi:hypothetical protein